MKYTLYREVTGITPELRSQHIIIIVYQAELNAQSHKKTTFPVKNCKV